METKICPNCGEMLLEIKPRCSCGHKFTMLCEGCGRDVKGYSLCGECRIHGNKRCPDPRNAPENFDFEGFEEKKDRHEIDPGHPKHAHHIPHYDWDCYDQYKRLQKLNKKAENRREKS